MAQCKYGSNGALVMHWNVRGINSHLHSLQQFISDKNPVIVCLQETLLREKQSVNLCRYHLVRKHSDMASARGVATAIKPGIPYTINDFVDIGIPPHHICDVTIHLKHYAVRVINIYRSPSVTFALNLEPLLAHMGPILLCGDFNARHTMWDPTLTNASGTKLANHLSNITTLHLLNDRTPTYIGGSALDLTFVSNELSGSCKWRVSDSLLSDHYAIEVVINDTVRDQHAPQVGGWRINRINWGNFNTHLEALLDDNPPLDNVVNEAAQLDNIINTALNKTTTKIKIGVQRPVRPDWQKDPEYRKLRNEQNRLVKLFQRHKLDSTLLLLRRTERALRILVRKIKEATWLKWCHELDHNTPIGEMWKKLKAIEGKATVTPTHPDPQVEADRLVHAYADRARSSQLPKEVQDKQRRMRSSRLKSLHKMSNTPDPATDKPFSMHELTTALLRKRNTAPGENGIVFRVLKHSSPQLWARLLSLFNTSWQIGTLTVQWKDAVIHCIPKPADPANPRPISLLSVIDKLMESMVAPRLLWKMGSLHPNIRGFTQGRSTQDCISYVLAQLSEHHNCRRKYRPVAVFLDLEKAFELANRLAITELLVKKGIRGRMLSWLADYLDHRTAKVRFQGTLSEPLTFENGTPQGSVLSPTLFNLLMEDIVQQPFHCATKVLSYADDLVLISTIPSQDSLERDLGLIEDRCEYLGLKISAEKSCAMAVQTNSVQPYHLELQGRRIHWVTEYKYLGIVIDKRLSMRKHLFVLKKRIEARLNLMRRLTSRSSGATLKVLKLYYTTAIRSILEYSAPASILMSPTSAKQLDALQSRALRTATRANGWVSGTALEYITSTEPLHVRRHKTVLKLIDKTLRDLTHPNHERLYALVNNFATPKNPKSWNAIALRIWQLAQLPVPDSFLPQIRAPWELEKVTFVTNLPDTRKSDVCPEQLQSMAYETIHTFVQPGDIVIYTDGSYDPNTNRAGCGILIQYNERTIEKSLRVNNHASSLQTELLAIYFALDLVQGQSKHTNTVLMTDSLAAMQTIQSPRVTDNTQIVHSIKDLLAECYNVTFIWVPSHCGIRGNEVADKLAKTSLEQKIRFTDLPSISISRQGKYINQHCNDLTLNHMLAVTETSPTFANMADRTKLATPCRLPAAAAEIRQFVFVLLGYKHPKQQPFININRSCPDCASPFSIEHHFFECAQHMEETAALALPGKTAAEKYKALTELSLRNPDPLLSFCKKHPIP